MITQPLGELFRLGKIPEDWREIAHRMQRVAQIESGIHRLLQGRSVLGEMRDDVQRLLEVGDRLSMRRAGGRSGARSAQIAHRLRPRLAPQGVVGEQLDLLRAPPAVQPLEGLHDPAVQLPTPVLEEAAVRHLMRQRVLERVLEIGEEMGLVQELGGLEVGELPPQRRLVHVGDGLEHRVRHILPDDRG